MTQVIYGPERAPGVHPARPAVAPPEAIAGQPPQEHDPTTFLERHGLLDLAAIDVVSKHDPSVSMPFSMAAARCPDMLVELDKGFVDVQNTAMKYGASEDDAKKDALETMMARLGGLAAEGSKPLVEKIAKKKLNPES